jgi:2-dehydro-3-deoxyphosphooctonate aldolase (KDO 8-P synthase)
VLETRDLTLSIAEELVAIASERKVPLVFKASFDKANRSSSRSARGPGLGAIEWLAEVRERFEVPVLTDVHQPDQCASAAEIVDVLQIPAFLCRQTDLPPRRRGAR